MPLHVSLNILKLVSSLAKTKQITRPIIDDLPPQKPFINTDKNSTLLERCTPKEVGLTQEYLDSFSNEIENDPSVVCNRYMVIKDNKVIFEKYNKPYVKETWNASFSLTKTTIALAIGALYDEKKLTLDDKVSKILLPANQVLSNPFNFNITIRNLLTMSTGNKFNESSSAVSKTWVKDFFNSTAKFKLGTDFDYNSLNTYILSAVVSKLSGKTTSEYLKEKIFDPLEIYDFFYETSPENIEKGGWGLYITPEDMAKLGILVLNKGNYNGKQIISEEWINEMSRTQIEVKMRGQNFDYGYQMWTEDDRGIACYNGLFDQDIVIFKKTKTIFIACSSNNSAFHTSNLFNIASKYFENEPDKNLELVTTIANKEIPNDESLMEYFNNLNDKYFAVKDESAVSVSVLPLVLQASMNTYTSGLSGFSFKQTKNGKCILHVDQINEDYNIKFDLKDGIRQTIKFYGNLYEVHAVGKMLRDDEEKPYLLIRLYFIEFASVRYIRFHFFSNPGSLYVNMTENPGIAFIFNLLAYQDEKTERFVERVSDFIGKDVAVAKIKGVISPNFFITQVDKSELKDDEKSFLNETK